MPVNSTLTINSDLLPPIPKVEVIIDESGISFIRSEYVVAKTRQIGDFYDLPEEDVKRAAETDVFLVAQPQIRRVQRARIESILTAGGVDPSKYPGVVGVLSHSGGTIIPGGSGFVRKLLTGAATSNYGGRDVILIEGFPNQTDLIDCKVGHELVHMLAGDGDLRGGFSTPGRRSPVLHEVGTEVVNLGANYPNKDIGELRNAVAAGNVPAGYRDGVLVLLETMHAAGLEAKEFGSLYFDKTRVGVQKIKEFYQRVLSGTYPINRKMVESNLGFLLSPLRKV